MVYNTQNYWVFGLFPSSDILKTRKNDDRTLNLFPSSGEGEDTYSVGSLRTETSQMSKTLCFIVFRIRDDGKSSKPQ
jgi:hypothetical protein